MVGFARMAALGCRVDWSAPAAGARVDEEVCVLLDEPAYGRPLTSSMCVPIDGVGVLRAEFELGADEGLTWRDALELLGYAPDLPVAVVTGQEAQVAEALRATQAADDAERHGEPWSLPGLAPSPSIVSPGPALQGSDVEAYKSVQFGPDLAATTVAQLRALCAKYRDVLGGSKGDGATLAPQ